jgi:hypothetical protein
MANFALSWSKKNNICTEMAATASDSHWLHCLLSLNLTSQQAIPFVTNHHFASLQHQLSFFQYHLSLHQHCHFDSWAVTSLQVVACISTLSFNFTSVCYFTSTHVVTLLHLTSLHAIAVFRAFTLMQHRVSLEHWNSSSKCKNVSVKLLCLAEEIYVMKVADRIYENY